MKVLRRNITNEYQWQIYKQLELIPSSVPNPQVHEFSFTFGLDQAWRWLLTALTDELVDEQQVEYLERCWLLNESGDEGNSHSSTLQRLWILMN